MKLTELEKLGDSFGPSDRMPLFFFGHGSPMNAIELNQFSREWQKIGQALPKPKAILCISAHWETKGTYVTAMERPRTIHDFGGFPAELFAVQYNAPGSPELAGQARAAIHTTQVLSDDQWGLDHGCWSVVRHLYPKADIPVVQMSIDYTKPPQYHYDLARELAVLRRKGILIIGSGNMVHNLGRVDWSRLKDPEYGFDWALTASDKMKKYILDGNHKDLINYKAQGPEFLLSIPSPEHYIPLLYTLGLQEKDEAPALFNDKAIMGSLTMTSVRFG